MRELAEKEKEKIENEERLRKEKEQKYNEQIRRMKIEKWIDRLIAVVSAFIALFAWLWK